MSLQEREAQVISDLLELEDWMFQYDYLLMQAASLEPCRPEDLRDQNLIRGCQSKVWIVVEVKDGRVYARAESYSMLVKGLLSILVGLIQGCPAQEVLSHSFEFLTHTSVAQQLSQERLAGFDAMVTYIKEEIRRNIT